MSLSKVTISKACAADALAAWDIRNAAILSQCTGHYPAELLAIWTDGAITAPFIDVVAELFYVATVDDAVVGTGMIDCATGRVDAIFVHPDMMRRGIGRQVVEVCLAEAKEFEIKKIFVLTYQDVFFGKLGFVLIDKRELPHKIWTDCIRCSKFPECDETAMVKMIV